MSIPRLLLAPSHRTGLANAVAAALAEIVTAHGRKVRYHHLGPLAPAACWDRWEGTAFLDPDLYDEETCCASTTWPPGRPTVVALGQPGRARPAGGLPVAPGRCRPDARLPGGARPRRPQMGRRHPGSGRGSQDPSLLAEPGGGACFRASPTAVTTKCCGSRWPPRPFPWWAASTRATVPAGTLLPREPGACRWTRPCWRRWSGRWTWPLSSTWPDSAASCRRRTC